MKNYLTGAGWAQPVVAKRWVPVTLALNWLARVTGYRWMTVCRLHCRTWELACGVGR